MNTLTIVGNTAKEVTYREKDKTQLASVPVAINYKYKDQKRVYFVDVILFGSIAKIIADFKLERGTLIFASGELNVEEWTNEEGKVFKNLKIIATSFNVIKRGKTEEERTTEKENIPFRDADGNKLEY